MKSTMWDFIHKIDQEEHYPDSGFPAGVEKQDNENGHRI